MRVLALAMVNLFALSAAYGKFLHVFSKFRHGLNVHLTPDRLNYIGPTAPFFLLFSLS